MDSKTKSEFKVTQVVNQISNSITAYGLFFAIAGLLALSLGFILTISSRGSFIIGGAFFGGAGICLLFLGREFRAFKKWTYRIVYFLVATMWGLRGSDIRQNKEDLHNPILRKAFGLEPVPEYVE